ncbi:hypothetical protein QQF64_001595 [Cirrhinus molitorella]|uniref:Uncharacterized protein n=1 Tax=Cirrhinus molitorella TaxID=172907 RepID=A0ABR3P111_9TELE
MVLISRSSTSAQRLPFNPSPAPTDAEHFAEQKTHCLRGIRSLRTVMAGWGWTCQDMTGLCKQTGLCHLFSLPNLGFGSLWALGGTRVGDYDTDLFL